MLWYELPMLFLARFPSDFCRKIYTEQRRQNVNRNGKNAINVSGRKTENSCDMKCYHHFRPGCCVWIHYAYMKIELNLSEWHAQAHRSRTHTIKFGLYSGLTTTTTKKKPTKSLLIRIYVVHLEMNRRCPISHISRVVNGYAGRIKYECLAPYSIFFFVSSNFRVFYGFSSIIAGVCWRCCCVSSFMASHTILYIWYIFFSKESKEKRNVILMMWVFECFKTHERIELYKCERIQELFARLHKWAKWWSCLITMNT